MARLAIPTHTPFFQRCIIWGIHFIRIMLLCIHKIIVFLQKRKNLTTKLT